MYGIGKDKETVRPAAVSLNRIRRFRRYLFEQAVFLRDGNMLKEKGGEWDAAVFFSQAVAFPLVPVDLVILQPPVPA